MKRILPIKSVKKQRRAAARAKGEEWRKANETKEEEREVKLAIKKPLERDLKGSRRRIFFMQLCKKFSFVFFFFFGLRRRA